jgi:hypothetical protein
MVCDQDVALWVRLKDDEGTATQPQAACAVVKIPQTKRNNAAAIDRTIIFAKVFM